MNSDSDYLKGYYDGMRDTFDNSEFDAYYAGVGYAKRNKGVKSIGFSSSQERESFERGMNSEAKHFTASRYEPLTFIERLLGKRERVERVKRSKKLYKKKQRNTNRIKNKHEKYKKRVNKTKNRSNRK